MTIRENKMIELYIYIYTYIYVHIYNFATQYPKFALGLIC